VGGDGRSRGRRRLRESWVKTGAPAIFTFKSNVIANFYY
jgi:hypothetical protein